MTGAAPARLKLLTFAPMVDSETSRLLLHHYDIAYDERDHLVPLVMLLTLFHGGSGRVPLLHGAGPALTSPWPIAEHYDATLPPERRLIPVDGPLAAQVKADWDLYNGGIGADTAAFAYFHLLPHPELMKPVFAAPVPPLEKFLLPVAYPLMRLLFNLLLHLSPEHAEQAAARIRATFDETDKRIADGRPYLCGDRLTIGDIALAAASAPLLLPEGYGATMPALEAMPAPVASLIRELRAHPTGMFVQRLYAEGFAKARG
jgi:glutathione S-transferase